MVDVTHEVFNQPEPLVGYNPFDGNQRRFALRYQVQRRSWTPTQPSSAPRWAARRCRPTRGWPIRATPVLHSHDRFGRRIRSGVEFHPGLPRAHARRRAAAGLHGTPRAHEQASRHAHVRRGAAFMMFTEAELSILCPISMTYAVTPALRSNAATHADRALGLTARLRSGPEDLARQGRPLTMGMRA
ncbi:MAG: hypothetical protein IPK34_17225 [Ramlibacter sp.]|nr:hypothetical protein [Ramlibacter sp.]